MAIDLSGQDSLLEEGTVFISIEKTHPLIQLGNALAWRVLMAAAVEDLKKTTSKGYWFTGRKLKVRIHLAAYLVAGAKRKFRPATCPERSEGSP